MERTAEATDAQLVAVDAAEPRRLRRAVRPAEIASLLGDRPLIPARRAATFRAIEQLPGLQYLAATRDPLGRAGVAVAEQTTAFGPFNVAAAHQRYEYELIFDPGSGRVLGSRTIALAPLPIPGVRAGTVLFAWVTSTPTSSSAVSFPRGSRSPPPGARRSRRRWPRCALRCTN